jgi:hypothetical protein
MNEMASAKSSISQVNHGFVSPKAPSYHGGRQDQNNMFNTSLHMGKQESASRRNGMMNGTVRERSNNLFNQHKQSATNIQVPFGGNQNMGAHYNTSGNNLFDDTEEGPLNANPNMNDYSFVNNTNMN